MEGNGCKTDKKDMIEQITEGKTLNDKTIEALKANEKSFAALAERYEMTSELNAEGALTIQFSAPTGVISTYTFCKAVG